jgi:hypothetical protein
LGSITSFAYAVNRTSQRTQVVETFGSAARTIAYAYDGLEWLARRA